MKKWFLLFIVLPAFACNSHDKSALYQELIQGDWVNTSDHMGWHKSGLVFSFEDSVCSYLFPFGDFTGYSIQNDSLLMTDQRYHQPNYKILALSGDSLVLFAKSTSKFVPDTIRLSKIKAKNSIIPDTIYFASSGCYGVCPSMFLQIDSSRKFIFYGNDFTKKKGGFKGQLSPNEYQSIISKIRNLSPDSLQEHYTAGWTDDQTCAVSILAGKRIIASSAYGFDKEPVALRILFHKLMEVYKTAALEPDPSINEEYFHFKLSQKNILSSILPPKIEPPRLKPSE
jgi:hypothetical protein